MGLFGLQMKSLIHFMISIKNYYCKSLKRTYAHALEHKISLNPILNSFQHYSSQNNIQADLIKAFLKSMRTDLHKQTYQTEKEYKEYIYGSADVVGLMCLQVFVKGDRKVYDKLKSAAMALGSAFQKVNFLRDLKADFRT